MAQHPASLRITEPDDIFLALTSYPPGGRAGEAQLLEFRKAIAVTVLHGSDCARIDGLRACFQAIRTDFGRPNSSMRFKA